MLCKYNKMTFVVDCNSKYKMCQCTGNKIKVWIRVKSVRPDTNTDIYVIKLKAHPSQFKLLSYSAHCYSLHYWGLKAVWKSHSYMLCYMYSGELEQVCAGVFTYVHLTLCACVCVCVRVCICIPRGESCSWRSRILTAHKSELLWHRPVSMQTMRWREGKGGGRGKQGKDLGWRGEGV